MISKNFKTADNLRCGIEYSLTNWALPDSQDGYIIDSVIVGRTPAWMARDTESYEINCGYLDVCERKESVWGIITPRTENFEINNVHFANFNFCECDNGIELDGTTYCIDRAAAFGTCSHCETWHSTS